VARFQPSYGYSYQQRRRGPRWPWVFALLIVAALAAAGAVLAAGGELTVDDLDPREPAREAAVIPTATPQPAATAAAAPTTTTASAPTQLTPAPSNGTDVEDDAGNNGASVDVRSILDDEGAATDEPAAATATTLPAPTEGATIEPASEPTPDPAALAVGGTPNDGGGEVAAADTTGGTGAPSAQSGTAGASPPAEQAGTDSPVVVAEEFAAHWESGDYDGLYDLLSSEAQDGIERQAFVDRYNAIAERAGLTEIRMEITGEPNLQTEIPTKVTMQSSKVGEIVEENAIKLVKEGGAWKVAWTPSLIFRDLGTDGCIEYAESGGKRGQILDRNGKPLAIDGQINQIGIVPGELTAEAGNETRVLRELSQLLDMSTDEIKELYQDAGDPSWFMPIKDVSAEEGERLLDEIAGLDGVRLLPATARTYPYGALTAHITGYLSRVTADDIAADPSLEGIEWVARAGIEAGADEILSGTPDARLSVVQCDTRAERALIKEQKGKPAKDVVLTIDVELQFAVDKALSDVEGEERGSSVILDPRTGAVLALVSHPSFDPNDFILGMTDQDADRLNDDILKPLLNRATMAGYPTGSIFKVITTAAALEHLGMTPETLIECPAQYTIPGTNVVANDWVVAEGVPAQGTLTLHQALVQSCNTVFYQLGYELDNKDPELLPEMTKAFGLGAPTGIPFLPETGGLVPSPEWKLDTVGDYWATGDAINLSIGQGYLLATPLQMANVYATIANGGDLLQPFIVEFSQDAAGQLERIGERTVTHELPIDREDVGAIQDALRDQTSNRAGVGSARVFGDFGWPIAGKTGTAQTDIGRATTPHSWFAAFGPYGEEATIASVVMVETKGEGVSYAAPATRAIYEYYIGTDLAAETGG
jgi:penicillin-binding protein 2